MPGRLPAGGLPSEPPAVSLQVVTKAPGSWSRQSIAWCSGQTANGSAWLHGAPSDSEVSSGKDGECTYRLHWREPEELIPSTARYDGRDSKTAGAWKGKYGTRAAWIPSVSGMEAQAGYRLEVDGAAFAWDSGTSDPRALESPRPA